MGLRHPAYYSEAIRVLGVGGLFMVNDYHPIRRLWLGAEGYEPSYFDRGPYRYTTDEGLPMFEHQWRVADHLQAVVDAGCRIVKVDEPRRERRR